MAERELDTDGRPISDVGNWHARKHAILRSYVGICRSVRRKFDTCTYLDPFSGPGRARVRETGTIEDGSPLVALAETKRFGAPFTQMMLGDIEEDYVDAVVARVIEQGGNAIWFKGPATDTVPKMIANLNPRGFHLAFIDPFSLGLLHFDIIRQLAAVPHLDMLVHVSVMDLARNLDHNIRGDQDRFDVVAPGWRQRVPAGGSAASRRTAFMGYWVSSIKALGLRVPPAMEIITNAQKGQLYWLALLSHNELAEDFWKKISDAARQSDLFDS